MVFKLIKCCPFAEEVSQTEPEEETQGNAEETEDINGENTNETTTVNDTDTHERLEGQNCLPQEPESTDHTQCSTNETEGPTGKYYQSNGLWLLLQGNI